MYKQHDLVCLENFSCSYFKPSLHPGGYLHSWLVRKWSRMQFRFSSLWSINYNSLVCLCKSGFEPFGQICFVKTATFMSNLRPEYWAKTMFKRGSFIRVVPHLPSFHFHITSQWGEMKSNEFLGNSRYNLYFILFLSQWKSKLKWNSHAGLFGAK